MQQFKQITCWDDNSEFSLTGKEVKDILNAFSTEKMPEWFEPILARHLNSGVINTKYEDFEGNPISSEQMNEMLQEYFQSLQNSSPN